ncbi:MAG: prenyltransferase/squalene oxidase repeat-containing protein [Isosphaeraceae bacterium]
MQRVARVRIRRSVRWLDGRVAVMLPLIPSWGTSLLIHGVVLLILALYLYVQAGGKRGPAFEGRFADQLKEDLTSLFPSDHAGDPFTDLKTDEPPSLSIEPPRPDETAISQPELPALTRFAPDLSGPEPAPLSEAVASTEGTKRVGTAKVAKGAVPKLSTVVTGLHTEDMTAPFSGRQTAARAKMVRREGGSVESEKAVEAGLAWIVRHQRADGSWSLDYHEQCVGGGCPSESPLESDTAATGLALLPLLGAGHTHTEKSRYQGNVRRGLEWLVASQQPTGEMFVGGTVIARMYTHAIATMALCEAYGLSGDPKLRGPAQRAIDFITESQNPETGGWRYVPGQSGDTSVFGWQMFALRSARLSGLRVSARVTRGCKTYLDLAAADRRKITYSYLPGRSASPVMTAEALLSRQYLGWPRDYPPLVKGASMVAADLERSQSRNIYYWYYATQLLHNMQNDDWKKWNLRVRDGLVGMQTLGDGCSRGSWDPVSPQPDEWADSTRKLGGGRLFLTALSVLTLEVYYRYLPLYQPSDRDRLKLEDRDRDAADKPDQPPTEKPATTPLKTDADAS